MAYVSVDDMTSELAAGKSYHSDFFKLSGASAHVAGNAYDLSLTTGVPVINTYPGTPLAAVVPTETTGWGVYHGGNVSTDTKYLLNAMLLSVGSNSAPGIAMLVDVAMYYPGVDLKATTLQTLDNTTTLSRYTGGLGLRPYIVVTNLVGNGASTPVISKFNYKNQANVDADFTGMTLNLTAGTTAIPPISKIAHCAPAANNAGPFLPLNAGDTGIKMVNSFQLSTAYTGATTVTGCIVLCKPITVVPLVGVGVPGERSFFAPAPILPVIPDGACLTWIYFAGAATAANSTFFGSFDVGWG